MRILLLSLLSIIGCASGKRGEFGAGYDASPGNCTQFVNLKTCYLGTCSKPPQFALDVSFKGWLFEVSDSRTKKVVRYPIRLGSGIDLPLQIEMSGTMFYLMVYSGLCPVDAPQCTSKTTFRVWDQLPPGFSQWPTGFYKENDIGGDNNCLDAAR